MAYRELGMIEVREVLRRFTLEEPVRAIARGTRVDRKTVAKYIAAGVATGLCRGSTLPTDAQVAAIIAAIRPPHIGRPAALAERLTAQRAQVEGWLAEGLRLTKIHRRLAAQGVRIPSLHRFAQRQLGFGAAAVTVSSSATRRGGRGRFRPVGTVARSDDGTPAPGLRIPRHPRVQPLRVSLAVSAAGSPDRPRRPGSGVEVLRRRAAPAGRR